MPFKGITFACTHVFENEIFNVNNEPKRFVPWKIDATLLLKLLSMQKYLYILMWVNNI